MLNIALLFRKIAIICFNISIFYSYANTIDKNKTYVKPFKISSFELFDKFNVIGQVRFKQSRSYFANYEGNIDFVTNDSKIVKGAVILTIDQDIAQANKSQSELSYKVAELNYSRNESLLRRKFISLEALEASKVKLLEAKSLLARTTQSFNDMIIAAPFDGQIGVIKVRAGDNVKKGDFLFSLINKEDSSAIFELPESLHGKIFKDTEVILSDDNGNNSTGKIITITPYLSNQGTITIEVINDDKNHFIHGSYLNAEFKINKHQGIAVPEQAVLKNQNGNYVYFISKDNIIKQLYVQLGTKTADMVEIISNDIKNGDLIVLEGLTKVQEGTQIEILN